MPCMGKLKIQQKVWCGGIAYCLECGRLIHTTKKDQSAEEAVYGEPW